MNIQIKSGPVDVGAGFTVEFSYDGKVFSFAWSPCFPSGKDIRKVNREIYFRERDAFIDRVAVETGKRIGVMDL